MYVYVCMCVYIYVYICNLQVEFSVLFEKGLSDHEQGH